VIVRGISAKDILAHNPHVYRAVGIDDAMPSVDVLHKILWHNEAGWGHNIHLVRFYAQQVGVEVCGALDLFLSEEDVESAAWVDKMPRPIVCYNNDGGWRSREYRMELVARILHDAGVTIIQVGNGKPYAGVGYNMVGHTTSIRQLGAILRQSDLYLGNDSGPFHVASAVDTKCVIVFTSVASSLRIHNRYREIGVRSDVCSGCFRKENEQLVISGGCPTGTYDCLRIDPHYVARRVMEVLDERNVRFEHGGI